MATMNDLIERAIVDRTQAQNTLDQLRAEVGTGTATPVQTRQAREARAAYDAADRHVEALKAEKLVDDEIDRLQAEVHPVAIRRPAYDRVARVGVEERTYRPDHDPNGKAFLLDVSRSFLFSDPTSSGRLQRHAAEEQVERAAYFEREERAAGTGAFAGLTVPQYLTDLYAPAIAALRPFADVCTTHHDLPPAGMTVNLSRITTATSAALQASENSGVSETNIDDTLLTINVQTAAGQQTLSRQAVERGTGIEDVTLQDLFKRYATVLDSTLIVQATTGLDAVAQALSGGYVDASPTVPELWPKLFANQNNVELALLAQAFPTHHVMHPRRWNWICSQVSSSWPVAGGALPPQLFANVLSNSYGQGLRGVLSNGMQVVTDANIATNVGAGTEDTIYTVSKDECHLWEDPAAPMFIRAEQPAAASLGVLLVVYGYFAYTHSRYTNAAGKINGTGLIAPVF